MASMTVLDDDDVARLLDPATAVTAAREALLAYADGRLAAPPRLQAPIGEELDLVLTVGGLRAGATGFRAYRAGRPAGDQLVACWDGDGRLVGIVVGSELGARRTGALGAAVTGALARPDSSRVGVVGSGAQAWSQLWATTVVRDLASVAVYSPDQSHREAFAARAERELGLSARAVDTAALAADSADILILATRSTSPVLADAEVAPGAHVVTIGPKRRDGHEAPPELADRAALVTCDSPEQAIAHPDSFFTDRPLVSAGDVLSGRHPGRQNPDDVTLHCSVGLAGSEVLLVAAILSREVTIG